MADAHDGELQALLDMQVDLAPGLVRVGVDAWEQLVTASSHVVYRVRLTDGRLGAVKLRRDLSADAAREYGHTVTSSIIADCAYWLFVGSLTGSAAAAVHLQVAPVVYRPFGLHGGTGWGLFSVWAEGDNGDTFMPVKGDAAPEDGWPLVMLYDAVTGSMDRGSGNYKWTSVRERVEVFDSGFGFARDGRVDSVGNRPLLARRHVMGLGALTDRDRELLAAVCGDDAQGLLIALIGKERAAAVVRRAETMLERGSVLEVGEL